MTGSKGFIGLNLCVRLREVYKEASGDTILEYHRQSKESLEELVQKADVIFHLAGINRPKNPDEYKSGNHELTEKLIEAVKKSGIRKKIIFTSSTQAALQNPYGISKSQAEQALIKCEKQNIADVVILKLPNVFGKWSKPHYNSAVATFCYRLARNEQIEIHDENHEMSLLYIDDLVTSFISLIDKRPEQNYFEVGPIYKIKLGQLAATLKEISQLNDINNPLGETGRGLYRALYATYISFLPTDKFAYPVKAHPDQRGTFVEMLRTQGSGQVSFFTAKPGVTRGGHYHHTKTEKFLVVKGTAHFKFRHLVTNEIHELQTTGENPMIVETIPGWSHNIKNIGAEEMIVMLWANEIFDRQNPDTIAAEV